MSLRALRQALIERDDLHGDAFCHAYAQAADEWLTGLFDRATGSEPRGMALVAVGGYGRAELCPFSDLDVVLVHRGKSDVSATADKIWYPVWDEGISLDHSVRRPAEALDMAAIDLRVALGLLDGRVICGDAKVAEPMLEGARDRWAKQKPPWLGVLGDLVTERHRSYGDVGFLLEPDLKESHGGLRDVAALTALMQAVPVLADYVDTVAIDDARAASDLDPGGAPPPGRTRAEQVAPPGTGPGGRRPRHGRFGRPHAARGHGRAHRGLGGRRRLAPPGCVVPPEGRISRPPPAASPEG